MVNKKNEVVLTEEEAMVISNLITRIFEKQNKGSDRIVFGRWEQKYYMDLPAVEEIYNKKLSPCVDRYLHK